MIYELLRPFLLACVPFVFAAAIGCGLIGLYELVLSLIHRRADSLPDRERDFYESQLQQLEADAEVYAERIP